MTSHSTRATVRGGPRRRAAQPEQGWSPEGIEQLGVAVCFTFAAGEPASLRWRVFDHEVLETRSGLLVASVTGRGAEQLFARESGGHRWQRVPPTDKRGRVHTSTVTVVVLPEPREYELVIDPRDLEEKFTRGSGAGGQHRNKTDTAVQLRHLPTGLSVRAEKGRSQTDNRATALRLLRAKLVEAQQQSSVLERDHDRRQQAGSGQRGDKVRTVALQRDRVTDHQTGKSCSAREYLRGKLRLVTQSR